MTDWLRQTLMSVTLGNALLGLLIFVATFAGSLALVSFLLVKLPATYFHPSHDREFWVDRHRAVRWAGVVAKNVIGLMLLVLGILMSLPGVPGQGILTILLGIMLLDFPGKRRLEHKIVSRPKILHAVNKLRGRFGQPPLILD